MENNSKMTENDAGKVWMQNLVIYGWFSTSASFCAIGHKILIGTLLSRTEGK